ncbi:MAG: hypothetical protein H0W78_00440 [Planctomycetes bacterium]|jgi:hypothetical protein|nr:hypothetical protein [Planctomycetota bacterium]
MIASTLSLPVDPGITDQTKARRQVAVLVITIYWLLILEGAVRKWLVPEFHQIVFFIRDPFAIAALMLAVNARLVPLSRLLIVAVLLTICLVFLAGYQVIALGYSPVVAAYGVRNYCFYPLVALTAMTVLTREELLALVKGTLLVSVPMAVLSVVQYLSPTSAWVNRSYGDGAVFTVAHGVVRTTGTFTFTAGMACFVAASVACLAVALHEQFRRRFLPLTVLLLCALGVTTCLAVSGSRTAFTHVAIIVGILLVMEFVVPPTRRNWRMLIGIPAMMAVLAGFAATVFPSALEILWERQTAAQESGEDFFTRTIGLMGGELSLIDRAEVLGSGIGGLSVGGASLTGGQAFAGGAENESERVVLELGLIFGPLYMLARWALALWLLGAAVAKLRREDDALPLLLWSVAGVMLVIGQATSQGTINGYTWLFTGFTLAALTARRASITGVNP